MRPSLLLVTVLCCGGCASGGLVATDIDGATQRLTGPDGHVSVLIFSAHECPISNAYAAEINRLDDAYRPRGVRFFIVHVDPDLSRPAARQHAAEYRYRCPVLLDSRHALVRRFRATTTPEAFVLDARGRVLYHGRIDDRYADLGVRRPQPTVRDLRDALDAILSGRPVANRATAAVGCPIPERES